MQALREGGERPQVRGLLAIDGGGSYDRDRAGEGLARIRAPALRSLRFVNARREGERRQHPRHILRTYWVYRGTFTAGTSRQGCLLLFVDASKGGLCLQSDVPFPRAKHFRLALETRPSWEAEVELAWQRQLAAGLHAGGLRLLEAVERLPMVERERNRRSQPRVDGIVRVELHLPDGRVADTFALDVSAGGVQVVHEDWLPEGADIGVRVFLDPAGPPLEESARVAWQRSGERVRAGLRFSGERSSTRERIRSFIGALLTREVSRHRGRG